MADEMYGGRLGHIRQIDDATCSKLITNDSWILSDTFLRPKCTEIHHRIVGVDRY